MTVGLKHKHARRAGAFFNGFLRIEIQFNLPDPIVLAKGAVNDCLSALSPSAIPSPDGDADN